MTSVRSDDPTRGDGDPRPPDPRSPDQRRLPELTAELSRAAESARAGAIDGELPGELSAALAQFRVEVDEEGEPVLQRPDGSVVDTWREGYPYPQRMTRREYDVAKRALQIELLTLQNWIKDSGERLVILFEGRDAAGKGGTIKRFTEHLNPRGARTVALDKPTARESTQWYFQRYVAHLPAGQYHQFTRQAPELERMLVSSGPHLVKFWFSVSRAEQRTRFLIRQIDPVRQWKLSPMDLESLDRWDAYTEAKEEMFALTDTDHAPWTVVKSNDKKRARLEAMRHVLAGFDYTGKSAAVVGTPDPLVVGPARTLYETGEEPRGATTSSDRPRPTATPARTVTGAADRPPPGVGGPRDGTARRGARCRRRGHAR